jgi:hypothetical protein
MAISFVDGDWVRRDQPLRNSDIALKDSSVGRLARPAPQVLAASIKF